MLIRLLVIVLSWAYEQSFLKMKCSVLQKFWMGVQAQQPAKLVLSANNTREYLIIAKLYKRV